MNTSKEKNAYTVLHKLVFNIKRKNPNYNDKYKGDTNLLKEDFAKFSYRFKYDDDEYSLMAPFTQSAFIPRQFGYFVNEDEKITAAINDFENWLKKTLILTKNIIPHNIVVKKIEGKLQLKIIDGLGCSSFLPLPKISNFFAKRYVSRRIELMHSRIDWDLSGRKGSWK